MVKWDFGQLTDLLNDLDKLSKTDRRKVMNKATRAAAKIVAVAVQANAPVKSGNLKRNIVALNMRKKGRQIGAAGVFIRTDGKAESGKNAFYWRFLELGTSKSAPHPFIRPGYDATATAADEKFIEVATADIQKALKLR